MSTLLAKRPGPAPAAARSDALYLELRRQIVRGQLGAGMRLSEGEIAMRFGVSRTPARDALGRLHAEGFLVPHGSRTRTQLAVAELDVVAMHDLYDTIGTLEGTAARTIAAMPRPRRLSIADEMDDHTLAFEKVLKRRPLDFELLFDNHGAFHETLVSRSERAHLQFIIGTVRHLVDRYEYSYAPLVGTDHTETLREHARITAALRRGDQDLAERAARANYTNSATRLAPAIARSMARPAPTRIAT